MRGGLRRQGALRVRQPDVRRGVLRRVRVRGLLPERRRVLPALGRGGGRAGHEGQPAAAKALVRLPEKLHRAALRDPAGMLCYIQTMVRTMVILPPH